MVANRPRSDRAGHTVPMEDTHEEAGATTDPLSPGDHSPAAMPCPVPAV